MPPISAILITYNEEHDLPRTLTALDGLADEIVVVDSGSTDRTCEIARVFGARVLSRPFAGFEDQKNFAASQTTHDWVLGFDADEVVSPELRASLLQWKQSEPACAGYEIARKAFYLGGWIRHSGWYPDYAIRLYRRDRGQFRGGVHAAVQTDGPVGRVSGDLLHYTVGSLAEHYAKMDASATKVAKQLYASGRRRWRGHMWISAPWTFFQRLILQRGFLDGYRGVVIAWTSSRYVWMKYDKLGALVRGGTLREDAWPQARNSRP